MARSKTVAMRTARCAAAANAMLDMDACWTRTFRDLGLHDLNYSDLLTQMWLRHETPLTKTQLYDFMPGISRRTAIKYVQDLIDRELLLEHASETDKRVRHVTLSATLEASLMDFLGYVHERFSRAVVT